MMMAAYRVRRWLKIALKIILVFVFISVIAYYTLLSWLNKNWVGAVNWDADAIEGAIAIAHGGDNFFPELAVLQNTLPETFKEKCVSEGKTFRTCLSPNGTGQSPDRVLLNKHCYGLQECAAISIGNTDVFHNAAMRASIRKVIENPCTYLPTLEQIDKKALQLKGYRQADWEVLRGSAPFGASGDSYNTLYYTQKRIDLHCDYGTYKGKVILGYFNDDFKTLLETEIFNLTLGEK